METSKHRVVKRGVAPKAWQFLWKHYINRLCKFMKFNGPFKMSAQQIFSQPSNRQRNIESSWQKVTGGSNLLYGIVLLSLCLCIVWIWGAPTSPQDKWIEFWGLIFDVFFILVVFEFFRHRLNKQALVQRYREIIEDYKCWDSEEAQFRIGGAVRRLKNFGITNFDFTGWRVSGFEFRSHQIKSIEGSTFYGDQLDGFFSPKIGYLRKVSFADVSCRSVVFSGSQFGGFIAGVTIEDCDFYRSDLRGAAFSGAELKWREVPPEDHYGVIDHEPDGCPIHTQVSEGPFSGANLMGANFENVQFVNADFREAENIEQAFFTGAKGLEACVFDDSEIKLKVISKAG